MSNGFLRFRLKITEAYQKQRLYPYPQKNEHQSLICACALYYPLSLQHVCKMISRATLYKNHISISLVVIQTLTYLIRKLNAVGTSICVTKKYPMCHGLQSLCGKNMQCRGQSVLCQMPISSLINCIKYLGQVT